MKAVPVQNSMASRKVYTSAAEVCSERKAAIASQARSNINRLPSNIL